MNKTKLVLAPLLIFPLSMVPRGAFGQAAAEAGLVNSLSSISATSAASSLAGATNRALQGQAAAVSKVSAPVTTTVAHRTRPAGSKVADSKVASSKVSAASTKNGQSGVATSTGQGAKLPSGVAHVWPEGALTQTPVAPQ